MQDDKTIRCISMVSNTTTTKEERRPHRFCVDFRFFNNATHSSGWPLPNIKHALGRLAKKELALTFPSIPSNLFITRVHLPWPVNSVSISICCVVWSLDPYVNWKAAYPPLSDKGVVFSINSTIDNVTSSDHYSCNFRLTPQSSDASSPLGWLSPLRLRCAIQLSLRCALCLNIYATTLPL